VFSKLQSSISTQLASLARSKEAREL